MKPTNNLLTNGFKVGDVIHNGWAGEDNCYSIVVGRGSIKQSPYSTRGTYKQRTFYKGKLSTHISQFVNNLDRQTKIGHIDYEGYIVERLQALLKGDSDGSNS